MALFQRRIHWLLPTILLVVITFSIWHPGFGRPPPPPPPVLEKPKTDEKPTEPPAQEPPKLPPVELGWEFDLERDELNFGLSDQQCQIAFPDLYHELDRARDHMLKENRKLTQEDIQPDKKGAVDSWRHGEFHCMIHNGELYVIKEVKGEPDRSRGLAALANMYRALSAVPNPRSIPNIEFVFDIEDKADLGEKQADRIRWAWSRPKGNPWLWVMPDFDGWSYPDDGVGGYVDFREDVRELEAEYRNGFEDKETKLSWRGSLAVNTGLRQGLVNASSMKSWSDVEAIDWHNRTNILAMTDFCRYKYVAHTEGNSWSGRLRYLHNCNSVPVIHDLEYVAHYYPLLKDNGPHQNYVKVKRDWTDLDETMTTLVRDQDKSRRIAAESVRIFRDRYLTPAAEACYWRKMFHTWKSVMAFEPQRYDTFENGTKVRRGVSWERFAFRQKASFEHGFFEPDLNDGEED
ncbi:putative duf821 domain-containing protein [Eutypa lata UCREL1]|uniref:Putative duf821 domain-containing protein n=1 Tax=Eutypa lata (strain UCR-EL1) TaxID=1287681 RepID=M7TQ65_EUTLA|nr:putative duf821 domain-containing protein [Eutypa lata UCREL1]